MTGFVETKKTWSVKILASPSTPLQYALLWNLKVVVASVLWFTIYSTARVARYETNWHTNKACCILGSKLTHRISWDCIRFYPLSLFTFLTEGHCHWQCWCSMLHTVPLRRWVCGGSFWRNWEMYECPLSRVHLCSLKSDVLDGPHRPLQWLTVCVCVCHICVSLSV